MPFSNFAKPCSGLNKIPGGLPNKQKSPGSTPGGDKNPIGVTSGRASGIKTAKLNMQSLPAMVTAVKKKPTM